MAAGLIRRSELQGIADAIRAKIGSTATYKPREMAAAIDAIRAADGRCPRTEQLTVFDNAAVLYWDSAASMTAQE